MKPSMSPKAASIVALGCAVGASVLLIVLPGYEGVQLSSVTGFSEERSRVEYGFLHVNGVRGLIVILIPVLATALPVLIPRFSRARIASAILLGLFVLISAASVGLLFLPAFLFCLFSALSVQGASDSA